MEFPLWELRDGPEWSQSVGEAEQAVEAAGSELDRFAANLDASRAALENDPHAFSQPFLGNRDDVRVFTTKDEAAGYRLVVFFRIQKRVCERGWVVLEWL